MPLRPTNVPKWEYWEYYGYHECMDAGGNMYISDLSYVFMCQLKRDIDANCVATCIFFNPKGRFRAFYRFQQSTRLKWLH